MHLQIQDIKSKRSAACNSMHFISSCLFWHGEADLLGEGLFDLDGILEADCLGEVLALLARHEYRDVLTLFLRNLFAFGLRNLQISDQHLVHKGDKYRAL